MQYREEELPQKQQLPVLRKSVDNVAELRQSFPINGTTLFGEPRPLSPSKRVRYLQRKAREREAKGRAKARERSYESETEGRATGYGGRRAKLERNNPSDSTSGSGVSVLPIPQDEGTYHTWSMHKPSTTSVVVDHQGRPTRPRTAPNHPATPPLALQSTHGLHGSNHSDSGGPVYLHFPYTATATVSSSTESGSSPDNTTQYSPTISDQETSSRASPTQSPTSSSPTASWIEERGTGAIPEASAALPISEPVSSPVQAAAWSDDRFIAVYQSYFIPCNVGESLDWSVPPAMLAPDEPVNRELCEALELAASAGYAHTLELQANLLPLGIPEEAYTAMHSSPPTVPSSYSELAHALGAPPYASTNISDSSKLAASRYRRSCPHDAVCGANFTTRQTHGDSQQSMTTSTWKY